MSKIAEQMKWYKTGRQATLEIARDAAKNGEDVLARLEEEIRYTDALKLPPTITKKQYQEAFRDIQIFTIDSMLLVAMSTLCENEDWGAEKLSEFAETMNTYAAAIVEGSIDFDGIKEMLKSVGVEVEFS